LGQNVAQGMVPVASGLAAFTRGTDPTYRKPVDVSGGVLSRLPGISKSQPPSLDQFGTEAKREGGLVDAMVNPLRRRTDQTVDDPVMREIARLYDAVGFTINRRNINKGHPASEINALVREEGPQIKQQLQRIIQSPAYQNLDDQAKADLLDRGFNLLF
jgi:hypothetical protein